MIGDNTYAIPPKVGKIGTKDVKESTIFDGAYPMWDATEGMIIYDVPAGGARPSGGRIRNR